MTDKTERLVHHHFYLNIPISNLQNPLLLSRMSNFATHCSDIFSKNIFKIASTLFYILEQSFMSKQEAFLEYFLKLRLTFSLYLFFHLRKVYKNSNFNYGDRRYVKKVLKGSENNLQFHGTK